MIVDMRRIRRQGLACLVGFLAVSVLLLGGCSAQELPTRAALAGNPGTPEAVTDGSLAPSVNALASPLPPTWTAAPMALNTEQPATAEVSASSPVKSEPAATIVLPTRTPLPTDTPLPTATATRYASSLPDLPPTDQLGPSKLGLHVVRNNDPGIMNFVRQAQPAVVKAVDDLGFLQEVKEASPRTITVGRVSVPNQDMKGDPDEAARRFVAENLALYQANPAVDYWEGWNEPDPNYDNMIWYSRFEQERVRQMAQHGFRCAIGGFATGVPELDEFQLFLPAIDVAMANGGVLSLHEYAAPDMAYLYGDPLPGYPAYPDRGSLTFRYRWFYREILEPASMVIPLIITEAGIDGIIGDRPGPAGRGWRDFQDYWVAQGLGNSGEQAYLRQLAWYDAGVRQDGYVIGFTVFTAGGIGNWSSYDINRILPVLADYAASQR